MVCWLANRSATYYMTERTSNVDHGALKGADKAWVNSNIDTLLLNVFVQRP